MKKLLLLAIAAFMLVAVGCNKKKDSNSGSTPTQKSVKSYFEVQGADYKSENLPASTIEVTPIVDMNNTVIPGGSCYVTVASDYEAAKILVGVEGKKGHYELPILSKSDREYVDDFIMVINQELSDGSFVILVGIVGLDGEITEYYSTEITVHAVGTGQLQVSLSFDNDKDIDLHLFEPNGEHIFYNNSWSENGGELDLDSNADCYIDGVNNENITYGEDAYVEPGVYIVYVDMWENCDPEIATNFVLTVFYEGEILETIEGINPIVGTFPVDEPSNYGSIDNIQPVCHFVIPDNGQAKSGKTIKHGPKFLKSVNK